MNYLGQSVTRNLHRFGQVCLWSLLLSGSKYPKVIICVVYVFNVQGTRHILQKLQYCGFLKGKNVLLVLWDSSVDAFWIYLNDFNITDKISVWDRGELEWKLSGTAGSHNESRPGSGKWVKAVRDSWIYKSCPRHRGLQLYNGQDDKENWCSRWPGERGANFNCEYGIRK